MRAAALLCVLMAAVVQARAAEPRLKWAYRARTNLYASPLVADVHPAPGLETIVSDAEVRTLRCLDARGRQLWAIRPGWKKRLIQSAALSFRARPGRGTLAIPNADGTLRCIDARTGAVLWTRNPGAVEWGGVLWADCDADGRDDIVVGTLESGIAAYDVGGRELWKWQGRPRDRAPTITCPLAACDVDGDGRPEIFAVTKLGPICLTSRGELKWERLTGDDFDSSPTIADADRDGKPELYCQSTLENALWRFDARTGAVAWQVALAAGADVYPGSSIAVGDLDADGLAEIVCADAEGTVGCFGCDGSRRWAFTNAMKVSASVALADVDGDGEIETLAACQDHTLYCLDAGGGLKWRFTAGLRLMLPATIADIDGDGKAEMLFGGSDHVLRCLTLGGRWDPALAPWPSRRCTVEQCGAPFGLRTSAAPTVEAPVSLLGNGGFEVSRATQKEADYPAGVGLFAERSAAPIRWVPARPVAAGECALDAAAAREGRFALRTAPAAGPLTLRSAPAPVERGVRDVSVSVWRRGARGSAAAVWIGTSGVIARAGLAPAQTDGEWTRLELRDASRPRGARWFTLELEAEAGTAWWDDARATGRSVRRAAVRALVNQVGYDCGAPKTFVAQANFEAKAAAWELVDAAGRVAFRSALEPQGRIVGAYGSDWGATCWRGDFSAFDRPGRYRARVVMDGVADTSWPFTIGRGVLVGRTAALALSFFWYQRCGMAIPGYHGACHLDDAANLAHTRQYRMPGGWHDAGDYNTYANAPYVFGLARAYEIAPGVFPPAFASELAWGADHIARMVLPDGSVTGDITSGYGYWGPAEIETDNIPGTGDERTVMLESGVDPSVHVAALAKSALILPARRAAYLAVAERGMRHVRGRRIRNPYVFAACVDLWLATHRPVYRTMARELFADFGMTWPSVARAYDRAFGENHREALAHSVLRHGDSLVARAANPFGMMTEGSPASPNYFGTPPADAFAAGGGGHNYQLMEAAERAAEAYAISGDARHQAFAVNQINWILGVNPYDLCMMEGAGSLNAPSYHNRLVFAGVPRGAVPGCIPNGITWTDRGDDRPFFDMRGDDIPPAASNEMWLPHNTNYLIALASLTRARSLHAAAR